MFSCRFGRITAYPAWNEGEQKLLSYPYSDVFASFMRKEFFFARSDLATDLTGTAGIPAAAAKRPLRRAATRRPPLVGLGSHRRVLFIQQVLLLSAGISRGERVCAVEHTHGDTVN